MFQSNLRAIDKPWDCVGVRHARRRYKRAQIGQTGFLPRHVNMKYCAEELTLQAKAISASRLPCVLQPGMTCTIGGIVHLRFILLSLDMKYHASLKLEV